MKNYKILFNGASGRDKVIIDTTEKERKHSVIGAGSVVNKNIGDYKMVYGLPVKEIKNRKKMKNI